MCDVETNRVWFEETARCQLCGQATTRRCTGLCVVTAKMGSGDKAMSRKRSRPRGWRQACHGRFKLSNFDLLEEVQLETIFVF